MEAAVPSAPLKPKAAGPMTIAKPTVANTRPIGLATTCLATSITARAGAVTASRKSDQRSYSGKPVAGLMMPAPPLERSIFASFGVMWANMVSLPRPLDIAILAASAIPPRAIPGGGVIACSGA